MKKKKQNKAAESFVIKLFNLKKEPCCRLPNKIEIEEFADELLRLLFPHFTQREYSNPDDIAEELYLLENKLCHILRPLNNSIKENPKDIAEHFFSQLPEIHDKLLMDAEAIAKGDPAAQNVDEVILSYPGFYAITMYRIAHSFYKMGIPFFPRLLTEYAHRLTGIDIHPGAQIGSSFCIDHGTGIVVGQTTVIGTNVKLYQGVTLGALSVSKALTNLKRHPTIEENCVIYSNATILGGGTIIGHGSIIGGNVWLTSSVQPYSVVYHKSEVKVGNAKMKDEPLNFII